MADPVAQDEWKRVNLGDVVRQVKHKIEEPESEGVTHYLPGGGISADGHRIFDWQPVNDGVMGPAFHMKFQPGHTLYKSRVPHGVGVADRVGVCANTTYVLEPTDEEVVHPGLLPYILSTDAFRRFEDRNNRGSTNLFLNFSDLARYEFALPPLEVQVRFNGVISAANEATNTSIDVLDSCRAVHDSLATHLFLSSTGKDGTRPLGEVCEKISVGIVVRPADHYTESSTGVPALIMKNVKRGWLDLADLNRITEAGHRLHSKSKLRTGDVVAVRSSGSAERTGDAAVVPEHLDGCNCVDLLIIRAGRQLLPEFVSAFLNAPSSRQLLLASSTGTMQKHLNVGQLKKVPIPLPDASSQKEIVEQLASLNAAIAAARERVATCRSYQQSLLEDLLGARQ